MAKNLTKELGAAQKRSAGVLGVFHRFVEELEGAADHASGVAEAAGLKVSEYADLRDAADSHAAETRAQARKIKGLLS